MLATILKTPVADTISMKIKKLNSLKWLYSKIQNGYIKIQTIDDDHNLWYGFIDWYLWYFRSHKSFNLYEIS